MRVFSTDRIKQVAVLGALAAGVFGFVISGPASAAGTSSSSYNCYTQWWNPAWAQKCGSGGASVVGNYESSVSCSAQGTRYKNVYRLAGSTSTAKGSDCTFSVGNGKIRYTGY